MLGIQLKQFHDIERPKKMSNQNRDQQLQRIFEAMELNCINDIEQDIIMKLAQAHLPNGGTDVDLEDISEQDFNKMVSIANRAIRKLVTNRGVYRAGPFYSNRKQRRAQAKQAKKRM